MADFFTVCTPIDACKQTKQYQSIFIYPFSTSLYILYFNSCNPLWSTCPVGSGTKDRIGVFDLKRR